jgi:hypothetical protein
MSSETLVTEFFETVTAHESVIPSAVAVILHTPTPLAVTIPEELTLATELSELSHMTLGSVASSGKTMAVSAKTSPTFMYFFP